MRKAQCPSASFTLLPGADGALNKVLGIESFTQSLCLKAFPGINSYNFFVSGDDSGR
jgi:hypothetical protein